VGLSGGGPISPHQLEGFIVRRFIVAVVSLLMLGLFVPSANAAPEAWEWGATIPSVATTTEYTDSPYFTGGRYRAKPICIHQMFTSTAWAPGDIGNAMEPAIDTGWRSASQGCGDYSSWQVMRVALYSAADGHCTKWTGTSNPASIYIGHPMNDWYNRVWDGVEFPTVWINQYYNNTCWIDETQYYLSREMLNVVGLQAYCSYTPGQESPMNGCGPSEFPGPLDRNRLTILMNP
jgi:hypothetical protein